LGDHGKQKNENELQSMFPKANKTTWMACLKNKKIYVEKKIYAKINICSSIIKKVYCSNLSTLLMQYMFFYVKKVTTTCVVLGEKYTHGDFGYGVL
jgi:hypothetical protein